MSDLVITVRGSSRQFHPAERATVHARVALEGPDPEEVYTGVVRQAGQVHDAVNALHDPTHGPVTWWSAKDVRTWAQRPWNKDGKILPHVHHARTDLQVKFKDFARLSNWLRTMASVTGFSVDRVEWTVTEARKTELVRKARAGAVADARAKAEAYAAALGLAAVRPVELAEAGMLGEGISPLGGHGGPMAREHAAGGEGDLQLVPEDIEVTERVDARFVAGPA